MGNVAPVQKVNVPTVRKQSTAAATKAYYGDNPYGSLGVSPGTAAKIDATPVASGGLAVTAPKAPAVSTPGHWNVPNYADLLAGDWEPEQAAIKGKQMQDQAETDFQLALRRAFVDYGGDVNGVDEKYRKYIDDPTIEAAKNNKFSTMAQNLAASTKNLANQRAQLAARGMTRSGANTETTRRALEARQLADYTAGRTFTGGAEEGLSGLAKTGQTIADMISEAKSRAAARIAQENPQTWEPGTGPDYAGESAYTNTPAAPTPWAGVSWGGHTGIKTRAALQQALGYNQSLAQWAQQHKSAWDQLT
jgi:hypothetical protein